MRLTANRLFLLAGAFIIALMAIDGLVRLNQSARPYYGAGTGSWVEANSAAALFLVGLVVGVVVGIGFFFASLMWRERRLMEQEGAQDFEALLAEIENLDDEDESDDPYDFGRPMFGEDPPSEDFAETRDPWEKPADWWKSGDDD
jgi:hypothetical protein